MNFGEMQALVKELVGDTLDVQFGKIIEFLNEGQRYIASELGGLYRVQSFSTMDNVGMFGGIQLPDDFLKVMHVNRGTTALVPGKYTDVYPQDGNNRTATSTGNASSYFITPYFYVDADTRVRRMEFYPPQGAGALLPDPITIQYIASTTDMVNIGDVSTVPTNLHMAVVMYAVYLCKIQENDYAAAQFIMENDIRPKIAVALADLNDAGNYSSYGEVNEIGSTVPSSYYE